MTSSEEIMEKLENRKEDLKDLGVERIGLFGSFSRGDQSEESDLDFLVKFREGEKTFRNFMDLKRFLEDLFEREIDLGTEKSLKSSIKKNVMEDIKYAETA